MTHEMHVASLSRMEMFQPRAHNGKEFRQSGELSSGVSGHSQERGLCSPMVVYDPVPTFTPVQSVAVCLLSPLSIAREEQRRIDGNVFPKTKSRFFLLRAKYFCNPVT